jgi:hypothetical protein
MRLLGKTAIVLGMAGAVALGSMTASEARGGRNAAAIAGGVAGFAAGAAIGSAAAANSGYYYGSGYGYDSYAYAPGYTSYGYYADGPARAYTGDPAYSGGYWGYGYNSNSSGPWHERQLEGRDY